MVNVPCLRRNYEILRIKSSSLTNAFREMLRNLINRVQFAQFHRSHIGKNQDSNMLPVLRPIYTGDFCRSNSMQFLSRSRLQLQNRTCKSGAIFSAICRRDIAGVSSMFET